MKLSAPIYILKQQAKALARREGIPLHRALDRIANREGFKAWSLLSLRRQADDPAAILQAALQPGELVLLAATPGQGKTLLSLDLLVRAVNRGGRAAFFTLCWTEAEVARHLGLVGARLADLADRLLVDTSDEISADYVIARLASRPAPSLIVLDYLQLLDQKRRNAELSRQVGQLKDFARERGIVVLCLSQIDRGYDPAAKPFPALGDVRLPNPLNLSLFDRACFLSNRRLQFG